MIECKLCGADFNPASPQKRKSGGLYHHCPDCSNESAVRYLGVSAGDGKISSIGIISFDSENDREAFRNMWHHNSGMNVGKSCQIGKVMPDPGVKFKTVVKTSSMNHKGRN